MRFLRRWLATETPNASRLLDAALIAALLPHLAMMKLPMLLYGVLVLALLLRGRQLSGVRVLPVAFLGAVAIAASFLGAFNFVGLSELSTFVQLVSSLLLFAVSLQRLGGTVNFYLTISPVLLLALSYFFYNSVFMLAYSVAALYVFVLLLLWARMRASLGEALRSASMLFAASLPVVALLFMVFPRISFEKKGFGFKESAAIRTGHDGLMHIGSDALLVPSKRVALEVWFETGMPAVQQLYFRGSVLYSDRGDVWVPLTYRRDARVLGRRSSAGGVDYRMTLYPHKKKWLYLLDYPLSLSRQANYSRDLIATWDTPVEEVFRYEATSQLAPGTSVAVEPHVMEAALQVQRGRDPQAEAVASRIRAEHPDAAARVAALSQWFGGQGLSYTLRPAIPDMEHPVDAFLFGSKSGYCVHFAAAYATMARMAGVPSRVVTGFKGDASKIIENYLVVREEDAHAWVEVYEEGWGWRRIDPTLFASGIAPTDTVTRQQLLKSEQSFWQRLSERVSLQVLYVKYVINKWILYYDRSRQAALLREFLNNTLFALKLAGSFALLFGAGIAAFVLLRREGCGDAVLCAMKPLLATLAKAGIVKARGEDMQAFLRRAGNEARTDFTKIDTLYQRLRYGGGEEEASLQRLRFLCRMFKLEK